MAQELINIGAAANDGTGDQLREAFSKTNLNFDEIYGGIIPTATPPGTLAGEDGNLAGMIATDATSIWVCHTDWVLPGTADIWIKTDIVASNAHIADTAAHVAVGTPATNFGAAGDLAGMIRTDATYIYVCMADYTVGGITIWDRITLPGDTW